MPVAKGHPSASWPGRARLRLGIVDDHPVFRLGLHQALREEGTTTPRWGVGSTAEALRLLAQEPVDVVLMDVNLGNASDGIEAARRIAEDYPAVKVIMVSASADEQILLAALQARAVGYLPKDLPPGDLIRSIRVLASPSSGAPLAVLHNLLDSIQGARPAAGIGNVAGPGSLSRRELQVIADIRAGRTNREIARRLGISTPTVNKHVQRILHKLQARNRAHAATIMSEHSPRS